MSKFGMKILQSKRASIALAFLIIAAGFLFGFWPLALVGVVLAVALGHWVSALLFGLLLDVAYGVPVGFFHFVYFPITLFAVVSVIVRSALMGRIRTTQTDTL